MGNASSKIARSVCSRRAGTVLASTFIVAVATMVTGCGGGGTSETVEARPALPTPSDLEGYDAGVRMEVIAALQRLEAAETDPVAWSRLGDLYLAHDRPALAIECYDASLLLEPDGVRPRYLRAWAHHDQGALDEARADIKRVIELDPGATHPKWRAAGWLVEAGELEAAATLAEASITPPDVDLNGVRMLASIRLDQGRPEDCVELLEPLVRSRPKDRGSHYVLGRAKQMLGRTEEAARHLRLAGDARSTFGDPWLNEVMARRADLAARLITVQQRSNEDRHDEAMDLLRSLSEMYGPRREIRYAELVVLANRGDHAGLLEAVPALVEDEPAWALPRFREAQSALAVARAVVPPDVEGVSRAVDAAETGIALAPGAVEGHELLGEALGTGGRWFEAAEAYRRCVDIAPFVARHHVQLADALARSGDPMAAVTVVDAMDRDFGRSVDAALVRARAFVLFGRIDEARAILEQCRRALPGHPGIPRTDAAIRRGRP